MTELKRARFDAVAERYGKNVSPIFRDPAIDLVELAELKSGDNVLDVGTGPGAAALLAASKVAPTGSVVGVDLSEEMLKLARGNAEQEALEIEFRQADVEALEFPEESFDVVLSSFGLGSTDPNKSLSSIRRVLKSGGRLALAHWVQFSRPAKAFYELLQRRRIAEPTPVLETLRSTDRIAQPWHDQFNTSEAMVALLGANGYREARAEVRQYTSDYGDADAYLEVPLSFPLAQAEFEALSPGNQRMFRHEFNAAMAPYRGPNRSIQGEDSILFAVASV